MTTGSWDISEVRKTSMEVRVKNEKRALTP
jgi:hypothetical protein